MANKGVMRLTDDTAGGKAIISFNQTVFAEGKLVMCKGDMVEQHDHDTLPIPMIEGSATVFVGGRPVCRQGDKARCGHPATGSSTVFSG